MYSTFRQLRSKRVDVLIGLWSTYGRDFEALFPMAWYLRKRKGLRVVFVPFFDPYWIDYFRPRLVLVGSSTGAPECLAFVKAAVARNVPTVTLFAEGNIKEKLIHQMTWGWNKEKVLHEDMTLAWSTRARDVILKYYPELESRLRVGGAPGFDRYRIYRFLARSELMRKYGKDYPWAVGYATWAFDRLEDLNFIRVLEPVFGDEGIQRLHRDREGVRNLLEGAIRANPDILFVLKLHPGTVRTETEVKGLERYPNTLTLKNEEPIGDVISACDLWTAFESTTCMEAWLLEKITLNLNPSGPDFPRDDVHRGAAIVQTLEAFQRAIETVRETNRLEAFEEKKANRVHVLRDVIQWDDGLNHVRSAKLVLDLLGDGKRYQRPNAVEFARTARLHWWIRLARTFPRVYPFSTKVVVHQRFSIRQLEAFKNRYGPQLTAFYEAHAKEMEQAEPV